MDGVRLPGTEHCSVCGAALSDPPPHPNLVCPVCARRAVPRTDRGRSSRRSGRSSEEPIYVDDHRCFRIVDDGQTITMRDGAGCESLEEFLERHYDENGDPIQWFAPGPDGIPIRIRAEPNELSALRKFLDRFDRATPFSVRTSEPALDRTTPVVGPRELHPEAVPLSAPPTFELTTLESDPRKVRLPWDAIDAVSVLDPGDVPEIQSTGEPIERATRLRELATVAPGIVRIDALDPLLSARDPDVRYVAVQALREVLSERPAAGLDQLEALERMIHSDGRPTTINALRSLATIAEMYPDAVAHLADPVVDRLDRGSELEDAAATKFLLCLAEDDPRAVIDVVPQLSALLSTIPSRASRQAMATLGLIAGEFPEQVIPAVPNLCDSLLADDVRYQISGTTALGRVTSAYPDAATPVVPVVLDLLEADRPELRGNAVGILADIADEYPTDVAPYTPEIGALLDDDDAAVRSNAAGALARIAAERPDRVRDCVPGFIDLLDDQWTPSRVHACWALGYCGTDESREKLQAVREEDPNDAVRDRASWALRRLE